MKKTMLKKATITGIALLMLTGGGTAAFADNYGGSSSYGNSKNWYDKKDNDKKDSKKNDYKESDNKITWKFKDENELKWALEYIMRLASKGVFNGYTDGTFKPSQKISRIETLTAAVRLMGLRELAESEEEMKTDLHFKDAKDVAPWAVGYVSVALENDLFFETETKVNPEDHATRLWSTILLIKALKLEDEAMLLNNTKLHFKDANQIPAGSVGYVALALEKGIIEGYNDQTFRPNQAVSRAELAALLDRTDDEMPDQDAQAIYGALKTAPANGSLTIVQSDETELTVPIDPTVFIFRDDKKSAVSDLQAGDKLFIRTYNQNVVFIEVTEKAPERNAFVNIGIIQTLGFNEQADLSTIILTDVGTETTNHSSAYAVADDLTIVGDPALLKIGQLVQVTGVDNTISTITMK